jgi:hypothetical protein
MVETSSGSGGGGGGETGRTGETAVKLGFANQLEKATCTEDESSGAKTKNRSPASTEDRELRSRQRRTRSRRGMKQSRRFFKKETKNPSIFCLAQSNVFHVTFCKAVFC